MSEREGFMQLIFLSVGVLSVYTFLLYIVEYDLMTGPPWLEVAEALTPIIVIICLLGMAAYVVTNR